MQRLDHAGHEVGAERWRHSETDRSHEAFGRAVGGIIEVAHRILYIARRAQQVASCRGQLHALGDAFEQLEPQAGLERPQLLAQSRLGQRKGVRRLAHIAGVGELREDRDLLESSHALPLAFLMGTAQEFELDYSAGTAHIGSTQRWRAT